jgi:hypothetical protein
MSAGPADDHKMVENPQYGEIYNSNSSIALACKLPMPRGIKGAVHVPIGHPGCIKRPMGTMLRAC